MIEKFEYLLALARERHFGRAATACGVTQPTLSAGIKQLEAALGVLLVNRGSRYVGLTVEGDRVLEWARRIVADARAMRQDVRAISQGLIGNMRIAAIPTAMPMVPMLTTPFRDRHPGVRFTVLSRNSAEIRALVETLEIDGGVTYLDNEALGRVRAVPLYRERYRLMTARDSPLGQRETVAWAEVAHLALCLLTPDMQNRRIIDHLLAADGQVPSPTLESDSMIALIAHIRTGRWAGVVPEKLASLLGQGEAIRSIPIVSPDATHTIGLVVPDRDPLTPLCAALVREARAVAEPGLVPKDSHAAAAPVVT